MIAEVSVMTRLPICVDQKKGLETQIRSLESCAIFIHCYGHALNLAIGDTIDETKYS